MAICLPFSQLVVAVGKVSHRDPLSPYIFIICAEFLSNKVRNNKSIKGMHINQTEHNISQYADDT